MPSGAAPQSPSKRDRSTLWEFQKAKNPELRELRTSKCELQTVNCSLMVSHALRQHLRMRRAERVWILPYRFPLAHSRIAIHVRCVLRDHLIDQKFALSRAVVHWKSRTEEPAHVGLRVRIIRGRGHN